MAMPGPASGCLREEASPSSSPMAKGRQPGLLAGFHLRQEQESAKLQGQGKFLGQVTAVVDKDQVEQHRGDGQPCRQRAKRPAQERQTGQTGGAQREQLDSPDAPSPA